MNNIKSILLLLVLVMSAVTASAADSLTVDRLIIQPGETKVMSLSLTNKVKYRAFQTEVTLPDGMSFVKKEDGTADVSLTDRAPSSFVINSVFKTGQTLRIVSYSDKNNVLTGDRGVLVSIKIKAGDSFQNGTVRVANTIFTTEANKDSKLDDTSTSVLPKTILTVTVNDTSREYGDDNPSFTLSYSGFRDGDTEKSLSKVPTVTTSATKKSNVGKYPLVASGGESDNYILKYVEGSLTITKAPLTIYPDNCTKKQGDPMPEFTASYKGFKNGENEDVLTKKPRFITDATVESAPGLYYINVMGADAQNYDIRFSNGTLTVVAADGVALTANSYTRVYGDDNPNFGFTSEGATLSGTPEITCEATKNSPVGTYPIVIKQGSVSNYNVSYVNGTLTITKAPLTISAGNYTKKQGSPMPEFKASYDGFKNGENEDVLTSKPSITTSATAASEPGQYAVNISGAYARNYEITYKSGTLTVMAADGIVLTANSYTRVYGDDNPNFGFTTDGATLNGTPDISCEATKNSPVGTYPIVIKQGSVSNYNVSYVNGTLTITKAPLTISAGNYTKKQGDQMPEFKASYEGFKNGENEDVLTSKPSFSTDANENSEPGDYEVRVGGAEAQNYDINYVNGTLTVIHAGKKQQTISWNQDFEVKTGQTIEMTATASSGLPVTYKSFDHFWDAHCNINGSQITFPESGSAVIIAMQEGNDDYEAAVPDTMYFNVLSDEEAEGLMYIDGIYYKYTDDSHTALKVVRGYKAYPSEVTIPNRVNDLPVTTLGNHAFYATEQLKAITFGDLIVNTEEGCLGDCKKLEKVILPEKTSEIHNWIMSGSTERLKEVHCRSVVPYKANNSIFNAGDDFYNRCTLYIPRGTMDAYKSAEPWNLFKNIIEEDVAATIVVNPVISTDNDVLTITSPTEGATIYYTLDGTEPDENSRVYSEPVALSASCYIKAFAKKDGLGTSEIVNGEYHNAQYPDIVKVGDVFTANIINNGEQNLKEYFEVTSVYPFEVTMKERKHYEEDWDNSNITGSLEVPSEVEYNGGSYIITKLDRYSLWYCNNIQSLKLNEGIKKIEGESLRKSGIKTLVIPNSVEFFGGANFTECYNLESVVFGSGLQKLGTSIFWACWSGKFKRLYSLNPVPPVFEDPNNSFEFGDGESLPDGFTLYVPTGSKSAYETAPGWDKLVGHIVEFDPTGIKNIMIDKAHSEGYWYTLSGVRLDKKPVKEGIYVHDGKKVVIKR